MPLRSAKLRVSLYADDAAIFINPTAQDLYATQCILESFGQILGLVTNFSKSSVHPICCDHLDLDQLLLPFPGSRMGFPCRYLGLQLHVRKLKRIHVQPLIDRLAARLPRWKGGMLASAGRLTLAKAVLSAIPIFHITVFPIAKWAIKKMNKITRSFLWKGKEEANGGHCLVNWSKVCRPRNLGGLGVPDLERFSRALRLRWLWFEWTCPNKPWVGTPPPVNKCDRALFSASTVVHIGDGRKATF